jgi:hypothetical protein
MRATTTSLSAEDMAPSTLTQQQTTHARTLPHKQERLAVTKGAANCHKGVADCYKEAADQRRAIRHFYEEEGMNE